MTQEVVGGPRGEATGTVITLGCLGFALLLLVTSMTVPAVRPAAGACGQLLRQILPRWHTAGWRGGGGWNAGAVTTYEQLVHDIRAFSLARDWRRFHDPKSLLIAMMGEVGELSELLQWLPASEAGARVREEPLAHRMGEELADVLIYLVQLADACGVDLIPAAHAKLAAVQEKYPVATSAGRAPSRPE